MPSNLDGVLTKPSLLKYQLGITGCGLRQNYEPTFFDFDTCIRSQSRHVGTRLHPARLLSLRAMNWPHYLSAFLLFLQESNGCWCKFRSFRILLLQSNPFVKILLCSTVECLRPSRTFYEVTFVSLCRVCTLIPTTFGRIKSLSPPSTAGRKFLCHLSSLERPTRLPNFWRNFHWERYFWCSMEFIYKWGERYFFFNVMRFVLYSSSVNPPCRFHFWEELSKTSLRGCKCKCKFKCFLCFILFGFWSFWCQFQLPAVPPPLHA